MITIEVNEETQVGKAILEVARLFSDREEGVRILLVELPREEDLDDRALEEGLQYLISKSRAYEFLEDEEDLYTDEDLIETYNEKR